MKPTCIYQNLEVNFISESDLGEIIQLTQTPSIAENMSLGPVDYQKVSSFLQPIIHDIKVALQQGVLPNHHVFILRKEGRFIGNGGILQHPCAQGNYMLACTVEQDAWKDGYGALICRYLIDYAFSLPDLYRLTAECMADNRSSVEILQKNGFHIEGIQKNYWYKNGRFTDNLLFGLFKQDLNMYN